MLRENSLFRLLNLLGVNTSGNDSYGYFSLPSEQIDRLVYSGKCTNRLSSTQIIVSDEEVSLGKKRYVIKNDVYEIEYYSEQEWSRIKSAYGHIKDVPAVPEMRFTECRIIHMPVLPNCVHLCQAEITPVHTSKFVAFMKGMNDAGFAHRDLHCKNVIASETDLFVVDWDFVISQKCPLDICYDVTGTGLTSPHKTNHCHIFKSFPNLGVSSVAKILGISSIEQLMVLAGTPV